MKITGEDYKLLQRKVEVVLSMSSIDKITEAYTNLSKTRLRFDLFYATRVVIGDGVGIIGNINIHDCKDAHIETAMKRILSDIGLNHIGIDTQ